MPLGINAQVLSLWHLKHWNFKHSFYFLGLCKNQNFKAQKMFCKDPPSMYKDHVTGSLLLLYLHGSYYSSKLPNGPVHSDSKFQTYMLLQWLCESCTFFFSFFLFCFCFFVCLFCFVLSYFRTSFSINGQLHFISKGTDLHVILSLQHLGHNANKLYCTSLLDS